MRRLQEGPKALQTALGLHECLRRCGADAADIYFVASDPVCVTYLGVSISCGPAEGNIKALWLEMLALWNDAAENGQIELWNTFRDQTDTVRLAALISALQARMTSPSEA